MKYHSKVSAISPQNPLIYTHRGFWQGCDDQNSLLAIIKAEQNDFGAEIDVRSHAGTVQLSHDPLQLSEYCTLNDLASLTLPLAINLKEDGILGLINNSGVLNRNENSFVFDGSTPQMLTAKKMGMRHALRVSEYEKTVAWHSDFIWLDSFETDWWLTEPKTLDFFNSSKVIVVSSELHSRDPMEMWSFLRMILRTKELNFGICTDRPREFMEYING